LPETTRVSLCLLPIAFENSVTTHELSHSLARTPVSIDGSCLIASAVLHADVALGADVEPSLKPILEGHGRHVEVISQALQAEVPSLFHTANMRGGEKNLN
jgi:hypothetical protein